ncbi:alpha/beta hydrolase family protein [Silvimonas iriomotensis]|uniref:Dienelactone hydrolase domain-containing protein n=1 Tax=Silvimonas iriomotensis TaxID=449662 RepID=A0ABQ2PA43_9NEIS|nr:alpha/beta fold hydrolase [Silvimonas iriomotensis]GGP21565.1 hypothetical protein GCM10010970_21110 [Silvimonas iriomotensis]
MRRAMFASVVFMFSALLARGEDVKLATDLQEQISQIPVTLTGLHGGTQTHDMVITTFRPAGAGPFPVVIISHGRATTPAERAAEGRFRYEVASRYFARKGFVVVVPTRIGYGVSGAAFDAEDSGHGSSSDPAIGVGNSTIETLAAIDFARALPGVDPKRIVLVGQSMGGLTTVSTASHNPPGVVAAINFAGGSGGDPDSHPGVPANPGALDALYTQWGKVTQLPMLWIYTQNDQFFGPRYSQQWATDFAAGGARVDYQLQPAFGNNGHFLFVQGSDLWTPIVERWLAAQGFTRTGLIARPAATSTAPVTADSALPGMGDKSSEVAKRYLALPQPRALAISGDGHWGEGHGDAALGKALGACQRNSPNTQCRLYAVDNDVVW